jgi:hypothetical protein
MKYFLKTADEASLWAFLESVSLAVKDYNPEDEANQRPEDADEAWEPFGEFSWRFTGEALDIIGSIWKPTGETVLDSEGNEMPEMAPIDGYHANMMASDGITGDAVIDEPSSPYRVWAS